MGDYDNVILGFLILFIVLTIIMFIMCCISCMRSVSYDMDIEKKVKTLENVEEQARASINWMDIFVNRMRDITWKVDKARAKTILKERLELQDLLRNPLINPDGNGIRLN